MNIAIVDDDRNEMQKLKDYLHTYGKENNISFQIFTYTDGLDFLQDYSPRFQVVFMDIDMPHSNGMYISQKLRQVDKSVCLVFVTNYVQYAVDGYSVDAVDYIVKPLNYPFFRTHFDKVLDAVSRRSDGFVNIPFGSGVVRLAVADIYYIEVLDHSLVYHTAVGDYQRWASLKAAQEELSAYGFERCNNCYLVNLMHVRKVDGNECVVAGDTLTISRGRKKTFLQSVVSFV